jgi:hypothetical protein
MAYHHGGSTWLDSDGMHLASSSDGVIWTPLVGSKTCRTDGANTPFGNGLFLAPRVGECRLLARAQAPFSHVVSNSTQCPVTRHMMRDPFVFWHPPSERFHAVWTNGWASPTIGYASSKNLIEWSTPQRELNVTRDLGDAINAWAPEAFFDSASSRTIIFWASARGPVWTKPADIQKTPQSIYYVTSDMVAMFTAPRVLLAPGHSVIDATMTSSDGSFFLVYKDARDKSLAVARSAELTGPYETVSVNIAPGLGWLEAPSVVRLGGGEFYSEFVVFADRYKDAGYAAVAAPSMMGPWRNISTLRVPKGTRHATVLKINSSQMHVLQSMSRQSIQTYRLKTVTGASTHFTVGGSPTPSFASESAKRMLPPNAMLPTPWRSTDRT